MVAVLDQMQEQVEHLRLDVNWYAAARQFASSRIEGTIAKEETHRPLLTG
jgi:hypothetical protein